MALLIAILFFHGSAFAIGHTVKPKIVDDDSYVTYVKNNGELTPISEEAKNNQIGIKNLKYSFSIREKVMGFIPIGRKAAIDRIAKDGGVTKVHYVHYVKKRGVFFVVFIPIPFSTYTTTVLGE